MNKNINSYSLEVLYLLTSELKSSASLRIMSHSLFDSTIQIKQNSSNKINISFSQSFDSSETSYIHFD